MKKERVCTKEDILKAQEILKKEPMMLDDVENWSYIVVEEQKQEKPKQKKQRRKYKVKN